MERNVLDRSRHSAPESKRMEAHSNMLPCRQNIRVQLSTDLPHGRKGVVRTDGEGEAVVPVHAVDADDFP
jgi:hypothetical protein